MNTILCHICCNEFDECKHRPRILSCGHTFCSICLKLLLKEGRITCPNCQKSHVTDKIEKININFLIESILSPGDEDKAVVFDTGYKCNEHCYEQNFFCETHKEWICRDCTVIQHKPCSHSNDCDNENDCRVITKKEKLDKIKSDKIEKLKSIYNICYGDVLKCRITECESKLNSKLIVRQDLQTRLKVVEEQNDSEIEVLIKNQNSLKDILSSIETNTNLTLVVQKEMLQAQGRIAVEESSKNIEKMIKSAQKWTDNELTSIREKENVTEVIIALKEFDDLKLKLCETEKNLFDCKVEKESITNQFKQSEEKILALENEFKLKLSKAENIYDNKDVHELITSQLKIKKLQLKKKELLLEEKELKLKLRKTEKDFHDSKVEHASITNQLKLNLRQSEERILALENELKEKDNKPIDNSEIENEYDFSYLETRNIFEVKKFVKDHYCYLITDKPSLGKLDLFSHGMKDYILVDAFGEYKTPSGTLNLECGPMISNLKWVDFVYLDIGKIENTVNGTELVGTPFGRLFIQLTSNPIRRKQMVEICSSITDKSWKCCPFTSIRNKSRPGELVTCKFYRDCDGSITDEVYQTDFLCDNIDHLISGGSVFGYKDAAGFSIMTRNKYNCYSSWPFLGEVVIGLDILKEAVNNHDAWTIGIHSHGVGFPICHTFT